MSYLSMREFRAALIKLFEPWERRQIRWLSRGCMSNAPGYSLRWA